MKTIENAYVLLNLGDSVTTDHISPAGSIARNSPAARFLASKGSVPVYIPCYPRSLFFPVRLRPLKNFLNITVL